MPIYEYQCNACGHRLEAMQKISETPLSECPECGQPSLAKLVSASGFRLKGGGWYETDFKEGNRRYGTQDSNQSGDAASSGSSNGSSESAAGKQKDGGGGGSPSGGGDQPAA